MAENKNHKENLKPFNQYTPEERKEIASRGGKASAAKRLQNRTFKEAMQWALDLPAVKGNPTVDKIRREYPSLTNRDAMAIAMTAEAIKNQDVRAFVAARDTTGELPAQTVNVKSDNTMSISVEIIGGMPTEEEETEDGISSEA